jgi:hypothetical protein
MRVSITEVDEVVALIRAVHRLLLERLLGQGPTIDAWNDVIRAHDALCTDGEDSLGSF